VPDRQSMEGRESRDGAAMQGAWLSLSCLLLIGDVGGGPAAEPSAALASDTGTQALESRILSLQAESSGDGRGSPRPC
jgi:hypothetical protein